MWPTDSGATAVGVGQTLRHWLRQAQGRLRAGT